MTTVVSHGSPSSSSPATAAKDTSSASTPSYSTTTTTPRLSLASLDTSFDMLPSLFTTTTSTSTSTPPLLQGNEGKIDMDSSSSSSLSGKDPLAAPPPAATVTQGQSPSLANDNNSNSSSASLRANGGMNGRAGGQGEAAAAGKDTAVSGDMQSPPLSAITDRTGQPENKDITTREGAQKANTIVDSDTATTFATDSALKSDTLSTGSPAFSSDASSRSATPPVNHNGENRGQLLQQQQAQAQQRSRSVSPSPQQMIAGHSHHHNYAPTSSSSPSPSPSPAASSSQPAPFSQQPPNKTILSPSSIPHPHSHPDAIQQAALMQAAFQQQQQHFQSQMAAMLAAGYSQHQLAQFQQHMYSPQAAAGVMPGVAGFPHQQHQQQPLHHQTHHHHHDPRRRSPSTPNTPHGHAHGHPHAHSQPQHHPNHQQQNGGYFPQYQQAGPPYQHPHQPYYHPQFNPHQYGQTSPQHFSPAQHAHPHTQYAAYPAPTPTPPLQHPHASSHGGPPSPMQRGNSPISAPPHSSSASHRAGPLPNGTHSPKRQRAPTAPSAFGGGNTASPVNGTSKVAAPHAPFAHPPRPSSPLSDPSRRRTESQPNEIGRKALSPTVAPQPAYARERTGSSSSEPRRTAVAQGPYARPSPPPSATQLHHKHSADFVPPPRLRTESGMSSSSRGSAASSGGSPRPASPASSSSDRAPTPTQALHQQLTGSTTSSGRTTPTATSQVQQLQQQQQLGLQPSIKLNSNGTSLDTAAGAIAGVQRRASPLSQQSSSYSDGHRSITPTQASGHAVNGAYHDSDEETEETISRISTEGANGSSGTNGKGKHRTTPSNASSAMSSPKTPSSGKSGSSSGGHQHQGSLFRNKLRKALSLSELNNSTSTLSSGDTSSKNIGRSSLTSNSSSSDTSHSTAEPRTPPNGASPVMPSSFASASASNLHSGLNSSQSRPVPNGGSLPSNTGRRFGILNAKMNSSTDNISISSTVSSASMMLRKMGNFGKLARKSSVRSLSNLFHRDKESKGNEDDDSAHHHNGGRATSDAVSEFGVPGAAMLSSKDRKKGGLANPSVAHVTVELERGEAGRSAGASGMTPAEALVRSHQKRERIQREEQEKLRLAQLAALAKEGSSDSSPRSKLLEKEKERLKSQGAGKKSLTKKFSFGAFQRSASSSSLRQEALNAAASPAPSRDEVRGTDSPHSSSSSSSTHPSPIFDSSATSSSSVSPVIYQHDLDTNDFSKPLDVDFRPSLDGIQFDSWRKTGVAPAQQSAATLPTGAYVHHGEEDYDSVDHQGEDDEGFDDRTPRQSVEMMADHPSGPGQYSDWDGEPPNASFFEDDTASFRDESDNTSRSNVSSQAPFYLHEPEDYSSDSGADGRNGQAIPKRPPPHARPNKGILKNARSYSQEVLRAPQPAFTRPRASSYDAPQQTQTPNQPGKQATLAQYIPSGEQVDGTAVDANSSHRHDTRGVNIPGAYVGYNNENLSPTSNSSFSPGTSPYSNPSLNTSEPILTNMKSVPMATRSVTGPLVKRKISFAQNLSVHTTWSGTTYDRRGEPATCNKLTPALAQRIKEELNAFKMEEMEVHHLSRNYTHFFV